MAFKEVTNSNNIKSYWPKKASERKAGDSVIGVYKERVERKNPDGTDAVLYLIETSDGMVGVNSSALIARAMSQVPYGSTVKITYNGKNRSQKTGREYNDFSVFIDTDDSEDKSSNLDLSGLDF